MKKIISVILIITMIVISIPNVFAKYYTEDGFEYILTENNEISISRYTGNETELEIPSEFNGLPVKGISTYCFGENETIEKVTVPESVEKIGMRAFMNCSNLVEVQLPDTVKSIDCDCFYNCRKLKKINLPSKITRINYNFLADCESLTEIEIPFGVKYIQMNAFAETSLVEVVIPDSVEIISSFAFSIDTLKSIYIPASVTTIQEDAFYAAKELTIKGYTGSSAENFAKKYNYNFVSVGTVETTEILDETTEPNESKEFDLPEPTETLVTESTVSGTTDPTEPTDTNTTEPTNPTESSEIQTTATTEAQIYIDGFHYLPYMVVGEHYYIKDADIYTWHLKTDGAVEFDGEKIIAKKIGEALLEGNAYDWRWYQGYKIKVIDSAPHPIKIELDNTYTIPYDLFDIYNWRIGNDNIISLKEDTIIPKAQGKTYLYGTNKNGGKYTYEITVSSTTDNKQHKHKTKVVKRKSATYFKKGYSGDTVCKTCGKVLKVGKKTAKRKLKIPKVTLTPKNNKIIVKCHKVKNATGFQVTYRKGKRMVTKTFNTKKTKKIIVEYPGINLNFYVSVRAFIKKGNQKAYSGRHTVIS